MKGKLCLGLHANCKRHLLLSIHRWMFRKAKSHDRFDSFVPIVEFIFTYFRNGIRLFHYGVEYRVASHLFLGWFVDRFVYWAERYISCSVFSIRYQMRALYKNIFIENKRSLQNANVYLKFELMRIFEWNLSGTFVSIFTKYLFSIAIKCTVCHIRLQICEFAIWVHFFLSVVEMHIFSIFCQNVRQCRPYFVMKV